MDESYWKDLVSTGMHVLQGKGNVFEICNDGRRPGIFDEVKLICYNFLVQC